MTLIEMLVALLIVLLMMSFIVTIYIRTMRVRDRTEELAAMQATTNAALGLIRRDLTGAFRRAVEVYEFGGYRAGAEFHWDAYDSSALEYHMLTFIAANDGSRREVDRLRAYEYNVVSWFVRGGALYRQIGPLDIPGITGASLPPGWSAEDAEPGLSTGVAVYSDVSSPVVDAGTYAGRPYIMTSTTNEPAGSLTLIFTQGPGPPPVPFPVAVTVCFPQPRVNPLPGWVSGFAPVQDTITVDVGGQVAYKPYALACQDGNVTIGPNDGDAADGMYFVIFEPLWFSLTEDGESGEGVESLVFRPPSPVSGYTITNGKGGIPSYVDVEITVSDPDHPSGKRVFSQRIGIPAGGGP